MSDDWDEDYPATSLDDDAYDQYVKRTFGGGGRVKGDPPVRLIIFVLIGIALIFAVYKLS